MKRKEKLLKEKEELVEEMEELEKELAEKITWVYYEVLKQVNERRIKKIKEEIKKINHLIYYIFER